MKHTPAVGAVVSILVFVAYLPTLCPTIFVGDSGELAIAASSLGIAHPPGFPLWTWLGRLAVVAGGTEPAYALNVLSAVCGALAAGCAAMLLTIWTGRPVVSSATALCFALCRPVWQSSIVAEVYSLNLLMTAGALTAAAASRTRPRLALLATFLLGLGCANHPFVLLAGLPVLVLTTMTGDRAHPFAFERWLPMFATFLLGLTAYVAVPVRWMAGPDSIWGGIRSLSEVVDHILRTQYGGLGEATADASLLDRVRIMGSLILDSVPWPFLVMAAVGLVATALAASRRRLVALVSFVALAGPLTAAAIRYEDTFLDRTVILVYFLPAILSVYLLVGVGIAWLEARLHAELGETRTGIVLTSVVLLAMVGFVHQSNVQACDRSESTLARAYASRVLNELPENARLYAIGDAECFALHYFQRVEGLRPDVALVDRSHNLFVRAYGDDFLALSRPERNQRTVEREIEMAYAEPDRPVFYVERIDLTPFPGCRLVPVGLVYQFLRPGETELETTHEPIALPSIDRGDFLESNLAGAAYFREAEYFRRLDRPREASSSLHAAANAAPRIGNVLRNVGLAHLALGNLADAEVQFDAALELNPEDVRARYNLALLYAQTNRVEQSLAEFDELLAQGVDLPEVHLNRGVQLIRAERLDDARDAANRALALVPDLEAAQKLLEAVKLGMEIGGRKGALEAGRSLGTVTSSGTLQLAQRYLEEGNLERATELYREVTEESPDNVSAAYGLGYALIQVGRYEEAANSFRWILAVSPESADARNALAYIFAQTGDSLQTAQTLAEEALELDPKLTAYWNDTLGWVRYRAGDYEGAVEVLQKAKEGLPLDDPSILAENDYHLGSALAALGRTEEAKDHLLASARRVKNEAWSLELKARMRELGIEENSI